MSCNIEPYRKVSIAHSVPSARLSELQCVDVPSELKTFGQRRKLHKQALHLNLLYGSTVSEIPVK